MMIKTTIITSAFLMLSIILNAQCFKSEINRYDEKGQRHGKWVEYWDMKEQYISGKGRYEHGIPVGKWKYYHLEGKRRMKYKYLKKGIKIKYYYESGKLDHKGWGYMDYTDKEIHFYWDGIWKWYDPKHKLRRMARYEKGQEVEILLSDDPDEMEN